MGLVSRTKYHYVGTRKIIWIGGKNASRGITIPKSIEKYLDIKDNTQALIYYSPEKRRLLIQLVDLGTFIEREEIDIPAELGASVEIVLRELMENRAELEKEKEKEKDMSV